MCPTVDEPDPFDGEQDNEHENDHDDASSIAPFDFNATLGGDLLADFDWIIVWSCLDAGCPAAGPFNFWPIETVVDRGTVCFEDCRFESRFLQGAPALNVTGARALTRVRTLPSRTRYVSSSMRSMRVSERSTSATGSGSSSARARSRAPATRWSRS